MKVLCSRGVFYVKHILVHILLCHKSYFVQLANVAVSDMLLLLFFLLLETNIVTYLKNEFYQNRDLDESISRTSER